VLQAPYCVLIILCGRSRFSSAFNSRHNELLGVACSSALPLWFVHVPLCRNLRPSPHVPYSPPSFFCHFTEASYSKKSWNRGRPGNLRVTATRHSAIFRRCLYARIPSCCVKKRKLLHRLRVGMRPSHPDAILGSVGLATLGFCTLKRSFLQGLYSDARRQTADSCFMR